MASYTLRYEVDGEFEETVDAVVDALSDAGFGVLCDIDVQAKLEEKLDEQFRKYRILGACNPSLAHRAMSEEIELGALLPCNVIVYETDETQRASESTSGEQPRADEGTIGVSAVDPGALLSVVDNSELDGVADEVRDRLDSVIGDVSGARRVEA